MKIGLSGLKILPSNVYTSTKLQSKLLLFVNKTAAAKCTEMKSMYKA